MIKEAPRPKPVNLWTVADVQKWYKRHCSEYSMYAELFLQVSLWMNFEALDELRNLTN